MIELPWASVVIPTYGEKGIALTRKCVETLRETHAHMLPEIIVVSDGDSESVMDILGLMSQEFQFNLLRIERKGFAAACNAGLHKADGAIGVFLVNNDIEFIEPCLQIMGNAMQVTRAGVIGCRLLYPDRTIQHGGVFFAETPDGPLPGYFDHIGRGAPENDPDCVQMRPSLVTGALLGINREFIERSGYLDERFGFSAEDIDLGLRSIECGLQSLYMGYTKAIHHEGASRGRTLEEKLALEPEVAQKEGASLAFLFQKYVGYDFARFGMGDQNVSL